MKKIGIHTRWLVTLLFLVGLAGQAEAKAPWQWQISLVPESRNDAMHMPHGLFIDASKDRYYVVDSGNNRLLSFDRKGQLLHAFTADDQLKSPIGMIRTETDDLWIVERGRNSLTQIDIRNKQTVPHTITDRGRLVFPDRIEYTNGSLYLLDKASGSILVLDLKLSVRQRIAAPTGKDNGGLVDFVLHGNEVWALDQKAKAVYRFKADGTVGGRINLGVEAHFPVSLAIGPRGFLYILDRLDNDIKAYDQEGRFSYSFLGAGQAQGQLYYPEEIRFDPWGNLCVVDEGNGRVEVYSR